MQCDTELVLSLPWHATQAQHLIRQINCRHLQTSSGVGIRGLSNRVHVCGMGTLLLEARCRVWLGSGRLMAASVVLVLAWRQASMAYHYRCCWCACWNSTPTVSAENPAPPFSLSPALLRRRLPHRPSAVTVVMSAQNCNVSTKHGSVHWSTDLPAEDCTRGACIIHAVSYSAAIPCKDLAPHTDACAPSSVRDRT